MKHKQEQETIAKNTGIILLGDVFSKVLSLILTIFITRNLGVEGFGSFSFALAFAGLFAILVDLGIDNYLKREIARKVSAINHFVSNALLAKSILGISTLIISLCVAFLMQYSQDTILLISIAVLTIIFEMLTGSFNAAFIATQKVSYTTVIKFSRVFFRLVISIILILLFHIQARELLLVFLGTQILSFVIHALVYNKKIVPFAWKANIAQAVHLVKKSLPFGIATIFIVIYFKIDITMLQRMIGDTAVGLYSAAYNLLDALYYIPIALTAALLPVAAVIYKKNTAQFQQIIHNASRFIFSVSIPIAVGTTIYAERIIHLIYGEEYAAAAQVLVLLIWVIVPSFFTYLLGLILISSNNEKIGMYITGGAAVLNIVANLLLIPKYGIIGASIATLVTELALMGADYLFVAKKAFRVSFQPLLLPALASTVMAAVLLVLHTIPLVLGILLGAIIYIATLILLKGITTKDLKMLQSLTKRGER